MKSIALSLSLLCLSAYSFAQTIDYRAKAKALVAQLSLEEKAGLCSGQTAWTTKAVERLGIPSIFMTDGPHGLRKAEGFDFTNSVPATCFPTASALASSWDTDLVQQVGVALGQECQANDVQILLGPGVNMKRSPLGGRNFEYFSEDPVLSGKLAASMINGVQSQGVGTSLKHFAANNQEFERFTMSSNPDSRTLHEIYLPAFEIAVKEAQPWTVMCAYNRLNGVFASENPFLLDETLRKQWGFKGFVVSDWGAVVDRTAGVNAGLDLEMPASGGYNDAKIVEAVKKGTLSIARLDEIVTELLAVVLKAKDSHKPGATYDKQAHHALARKVSSECIVLLKNEKEILPLSTKSKKIAVIGAFAKAPRYQGSGSSQVKPTNLSNAYDELGTLLGASVNLRYAAGYNTEGETNDKLIEEAVQAAKQSEVAVVFAGLPSSYESEGYDRTNIDMPNGHNRLIDAVAAVQPNLVVVLMNGSAVTMPWASKTRAIVEGWLGGQASGGAVADVLTGKVNPSGKLSETFPQKLEDTPAYLEFPTLTGEARYGEGLYIGYRYYDKKKIEPLFPFGYGLSYTQFTYESIQADKTNLKDSDPLTVSVKVKNTGKTAGKEVVQLYVRDAFNQAQRPEKELKQFVKVALQPGEEKTVTFHLGFRDFAWYNPAINDWQVSSGNFDLLAGGSSRNLPLKQTVSVEKTKTVYPKLTRFSMMKEFDAHPKGKAVYEQIIGGMGAPGQSAEDAKKTRAMMEVFLRDMPIFKMIAMSQGKFTEAMLDGILGTVNE